MYTLKKEFNPKYFRKMAEDARKYKKVAQLEEIIFKQIEEAASAGKQSITIELNTPYGTAEADREIIESLKEVGFVVIPNTASMNKFYIKW